MEIFISETAPILRVMTDISEIKNPIQGMDEKDEQAEGITREPSFRQQGQFSNKKKFLHPIYGCNPYRPKANCNSYHPVNSNPQNNVSAFTQRIMSAKLLRVKQLQNQLTETQSQLNELMNENRMLKALHKRQDNALKKYEGSQEQLPQLIKSHNEELRVLNSKYKALRMNYRELENKLKQRDVELTNLKEQHKHLVKLSKDKQLWDREKLAKKVDAMEITIKEQHKKIQLLNRKVELEGKNHRHQLNIEMNRHKDTQNQLNVALDTIKSLKTSAEAKEKYVLFPKKFHRTPQHSQLSFPGPSRVSIRKNNNQRLIQSETAMQDGIEIVTDSSMSNVTSSHGPQESSQEDPSCGTSPNTEIPTGNKFKGPMRNEVFWNNGTLLGRKDPNKIYNPLGNKEKIKSENDSLPKEFQLLSIKHIKREPIKSSEVEEIDNKLYLKNQGRPYTSKDLKDVSKERKWSSDSQRRIPSGYLEESPERMVSKVGSAKPANVSFYDRSSALNLRSRKDSLGSSSDSLSQDEIENNLHNLEKRYGTEFGKEESSGASGQDTANEKFSNSSSRPLSRDMNDELQKEIEDMLEKNKVSDDGSTDTIENEIDSPGAGLSNVELSDGEKKETEDDIERIVKEACKGMMESDESDTELKEFEMHERETWEELKKKVNDNLEEIRDVDMIPTEDIKLGDHQKADLLKALDRIDQEEKNSEKIPEKKTYVRTSSNSVERLHKGKPVHDDLKIPVLEKIRKEDEEFATGKLDKTAKKSNIMKELFGESRGIFDST